jgi:hypothetical protein
MFGRGVTSFELGSRRSFVDRGLTHRFREKKKPCQIARLRRNCVVFSSELAEVIPMKIAIPEVAISQARVQEVSVGEVKIGSVKIDQLTVSSIRVQTSSGTAQMRNLRIKLTLKFGLDWRVGVKISMPDGIPDVDFTNSGTLDLGTLTLGIGFGNITLPGFANLSFDIPSLSVNDISAVIGSIKDLNLGAILAERIRAQNVLAPTAGFQITGLGVNGVSVRGVSSPDAAVADATIRRAAGGPLPIANFTVPGLTLPQATIPQVSSQNVDAMSNPVVAKLPKADIGLLAATLKVTTTAAFHLDELRIGGAETWRSAATVSRSRQRGERRIGFTG